MISTGCDEENLYVGTRAQRHRRQVTLFVAALGAMLLIGWLVYRPGLSGDFLFDDFGNLPALGATGAINHWATFWRYITSGAADPTGRPLTLLTFLLDARNWPADPRPFKITNVFLHLLNGALLCAVLLRLGRAVRLSECQARVAALFGAGAWLLHPLLVSTTLYIVQREAMLPATFTLLGMLGWISARQALAQGYTRRGLAGMLVSAWGCTLLATLSKANGALLPLLLFLVEWIALASRRPIPTTGAERGRRAAVAVLLILPTILLFAWLLLRTPGMARQAAAIRDWSIGQRLLTEPRVLTDYLHLLFVPRAHSSGLLNDAFVASTDWLHPESTLPCILFVLALLGAGFALRKKYPAVALALLFYFAGQLLESSWPPLELYYEHRNYLPAMLLFWPVGVGLGAPGALRWPRGLVAAGVLCFLVALTLQRASLWGDGYNQAQIWAAINPGSARAQTNAAQYDMAHGRPRLAAARLRNALSAHPNDLEISLNLINTECRMHALRPPSLQAAQRALAKAKVGGTLGFDWFEGAIEMAKRHECDGLDFLTVQSLLESARHNPYWGKISGRQQDLIHLQGMLYLAENHPEQALQAFNAALAIEPQPDTSLGQAAILGSSGYPNLGLMHLDFAATLPPPSSPAVGMPRIHAWILARQHYWRHETAHLRATLAAEAAKQHGPSDTVPD